MMEHLSPYQYLIAFPQLISRICHPNSDVFTRLEVCTFIVQTDVVKFIPVIYPSIRISRAQAVGHIEVLHENHFQYNIALI